MFSEKVRKYCKIPYPGYPSGCPNYGKSSLCPPNSQYRPDILQKYTRFILVFAEFDLKGYKDILRKEHPDWSERQLGNSRFWQKAVKKELRGAIGGIYGVKYDEVLGCGSGFKLWRTNETGGFREIECQSMESAGILAMSMFQRNGIVFERNPSNKVVMAALCMSNEKPVKKPPTLFSFIQKPGEKQRDK